ncbi:MAG: acyl-CoA reductase [Cyclobacteriaceae bacterium]|nr:acyl-CoA reductase [Cyclobacteriaceae bacterium]
MNLNSRIEAFTELGNRITNLKHAKKESIFTHASQNNAWFTPPSVEAALSGISHFLRAQTLQTWLGRYQLTDVSKTVGIAMAGNIPLVGFHDLLCVLISGHKAMIKPSAQDNYLVELLIKWLIEIEPGFANRIQIEERLNKAEAMVATGSDNTSRYFEYYFRNLPHIIRKNRSSCAIIMGEEPADELQKLGTDVFTYFGLGCRNVAKLFVPADYEFSGLLDSWKPYEEIINHHKYANNYDYQKSILLVNQTPFFDNGFVLLTENVNLVSPISVLFFERYLDQADLQQKLRSHEEKLQCIVSVKGWYTNSIPFGKAQQPDVWDYADNVDTMKFLAAL